MGEPGSTADNWPIPVAHISAVQQSAFWEIQIARYGVLALQNFPKIVGAVDTVQGRSDGLPYQKVYGSECHEWLRDDPIRGWTVKDHHGMFVPNGVYDRRSARVERMEMAQPLVKRFMRRRRIEQTLEDEEGDEEEDEEMDPERDARDFLIVTDEEDLGEDEEDGDNQGEQNPQPEFNFELGPEFPKWPGSQSEKKPPGGGPPGSGSQQNPENTVDYDMPDYF